MLKPVSAKIAPLQGKYYGTKVEIDFAGEGREISIWIGKGSPSQRELSENEEIDYNHYEDEESYFIAQLLVLALTVWRQD
jgi:hypothetical protein